MRVAIDTNRLTDLFRGDIELAVTFSHCEEIWLPLPVLAEIKAGFLGGTRRPEDEAVLQEFLAKNRVQVLLPSRETAEHYGRLYVQLKSAGTPIPINDLWIAALALEHSLILITRDPHFKKVPQLLRA